MTPTRASASGSTPTTSCCCGFPRPSRPSSQVECSPSPCSSPRSRWRIRSTRRRSIPGLWLASAPAAGRLASFTLGVFAVYTTGGLVLLFGPGRVLINALHHFHGPFEHALEAVGGLLVLVVAGVLWRSRSGGDDEPRARRSYTRASAFALGAGIMAFELPTAFMYFGVISAILAAHPAAPVRVLRWWSPTTCCSSRRSSRCWRSAAWGGDAGRPMDRVGRDAGALRRSACAQRRGRPGRHSAPGDRPQRADRRLASRYTTQKAMTAYCSAAAATTSR